MTKLDIKQLRDDAVRHLTQREGQIVDTWYIDHRTEEEAGADIRLKGEIYHLTIFGKKHGRT